MDQPHDSQNTDNDPEMEAKLPPEALAQLPAEPEQEALPEHAANQPLPQTEQLILPPKNPYKKPLLIALVILLAAGGAAAAYELTKGTKKPAVSNTPAVSIKQTVTNTPKVQGLALDPAKNYGDKYAGGLLPVGDGKYVTDAAKAGYIYACSGYANNLKTAAGGAGSRGPWFVNNNTQYDLNKKLHVQGSVMWQASFSNKISGSARTITTNDLPAHQTGTFPISASDPAYAYDRNPNSIKGQTFTYSLSASPAYGSPMCMGGQVGVMLSGIALFNGFDAGGRDAGAWEIQDSCSGHPEKEGIYHYHTLSSCIKDTSVKTVIGFALDGFPVTGPSVGGKNILTTSDLDECHGIVSDVVLDGKQVTTYHYVMTQDFPYSASCFRAAPITPPGQSNGIPANQH
jgi:hypothetical protein